MNTAKEDILHWESFRKGDREAFATLFRNHYPALYRYGSKFTTDHQQLEDAIQELFIELWKSNSRNTVISVDVTGRIHTDSGPGLYASVMSGLGIAQASAAMCDAELRSGALVALLTDYGLEPVEVHAVLPGGPRPSAKVRGFTDFLVAAFKTAPYAL